MRKGDPHTLDNSESKYGKSSDGMMQGELLFHHMGKPPGGAFLMGSDRHYAEEAPAHRVMVAPFWMDRMPVTNREFRRFVDATGYVTDAEIAPSSNDYPGALPQMLKPGSLVFTPPRHPVNLGDWGQWWRFEFGANWRRPC